MLLLINHSKNCKSGNSKYRNQEMRREDIIVTALPTVYASTQSHGITVDVTSDRFKYCKSVNDQSGDLRCGDRSAKGTWLYKKNSALKLG